MRWSSVSASCTLGRGDARGKVIVENAAQIQGESDDKIIIGAHEGDYLRCRTRRTRATGSIGGDCPRSSP